ncbi:phage/plasmid-related protein [Mycolicibacterium conceptionense]|uniref:Phage/plasmid-related protein n=1 Tax=Mycolicibacterium conceptionense TaxID=451644 RepID=A0A0U1DYM6_9MYCO|nr:DUF932 domain-containing protein [Mycolicibacterium conceptionense]ORV21713.1 hypothetical protein AWB98_27050 [Mycolicibacterium conceptionense]CQD25087.1 phage/plasmid-related protein [Mycolicibacterium conceptionense]
MAHQLDSTRGRVSFADSQTDAWHQLGQQVGHLMTSQDVLEAAHLARWNVRKVPLQVAQDPIVTADGTVITPNPLVVPDHYATVRDNPIVPGQIDVLGVVGSKYQPLQNEASCDFLTALIDESGAVFETAGALNGGRQTFVTLKLPETMVFDRKDGSKDRTDLYIAALNSHDGTAAFRGIVTPVRVVCANTQTAAIREAKASFAIRHTGSARIAIQQAREALRLAWRYLDVFQSEAAHLYATPMDTDEVCAFANRLVDVDGATSLAAKNARREQASGIVKLWVSSPTVAPVAGTRWGAYNAVTEYVDHHAKVRGRGNPEAVRALRAVTTGSSAQTLKTTAFTMLQTL